LVSYPDDTTDKALSPTHPSDFKRLGYKGSAIGYSTASVSCAEKLFSAQ
jgi:hypothetical protein